ncbi:hypothetical protein NQ314_011989 [Rhamnusium bicolor]|uniref:DUF4371 domain-containing protein n=1 Tax=Rhamnusium bicolor TaxID=1586634 RepID=A0AAV8XGU0_9CUCU|nr:hypothetical protein NQ314_011989 [Rhamnusium bicolor]
MGSDSTVKRAELKLCALLASNNLPFTLMDTLGPLIFNTCPDSKIAKNMSIRRTKATAVMKVALEDKLSEDLYSILSSPGHYFSIIMDESTDKGTRKQCAFTVIYIFPQSDKVVTKFFDITETSVTTADELYKCLKNSISSKNIPLSNLVGFSSDTTNVMLGDNHSVYTHLKQDLPFIVCIKYSCHMIHLSSAKACLLLPRSVEDLLRNLGSHFSRIEAFKEF